MSQSFTSQSLGKRIMKLRKAKGFSQEELASHIGISRTSLVQIESGKRGVDVLEVHKMSLVLGFSIDDILSENFGMGYAKDDADSDVIREPKEELRISVPVLKQAKFRNVLLYILERCAGKPNFGETVLNKILYFCDFNYYELYEESLTGARYKKLPYGPVPQKLDQIIRGMIEKGQLQRVKSEYNGYPQTRYLPLEKPDLTALSAAEKTVIDQVLQQLSDWSASKISEYSHKDMPWLATEDGQYIHYNLAFYRELPFSVRVYEEEQE
ncbi:MAG: type II toxin-antitoxin system antitoxin SocA domain-containing protein [Flavobacteriales bacterium]